MLFIHGIHLNFTNERTQRIRRFKSRRRRSGAQLVLRVFLAGKEVAEAGPLGATVRRGAGVGARGRPGRRGRVQGIVAAAARHRQKRPLLLGSQEITEEKRVTLKTRKG